METRKRQNSLSKKHKMKDEEEEYDEQEELDLLEEEEQEKEQETDDDESYENEDKTLVILIIMAIYLVTIGPMLYYYTPTGQRGVDFYYLTNKTLDWNMFHPTVEEISKIPVRPETKLSFIIHGFSESSYRPWIHRLAQAILSREDGHNIVMIIDYWDLHRAEYFWMRSNAHYVARLIAKLLDNLVLNNGLQLSKTHLIGFSLGGQISGITGSKIKTGKLGRITALDPTFPYLDWQHDEESVDKDDAEFVVVLRTSAVSYFSPPSHVDIFANGGVVQPGCDLWWYTHFVQQACSHFRPVMLVLEAEQRAGKGAFPMCLCSDYEAFKNGSCPCQVTTNFDMTTFSGSHGKFYMTTHENPPYTIVPSVGQHSKNR